MRAQLHLQRLSRRACTWWLCAAALCGGGIDAAVAQTPPNPKSEAAGTPRDEVKRQAEAAYKAKDWAALVAAAELALDADSNDVYALIWRSIGSNGLDRHAEALIASEKAVSIAPGNKDAQAQVCRAHVLLRQLQAAQASCAKSVDLAPESFPQAVFYAHVYLLRGDDSTARQMYERAMTRLNNERQVQAALDDFGLFEHRGWRPAESREAAAWFKDRAQRWMKALTTVLPFAARLSEVGDGDQQRATLAEAQRLHAFSEQLLGPDNLLSGGMLAAVGVRQAALGDYDSALKTSLQADSIVSKADPQGYSRATLSARLSLAFAAQLTGQYGTAVEQARQAHTVAVRLAGPDNEITLIAERTLAIVLESIGAEEQALAILERHLVLYEKREGADGPKVATTLRFIGSCLDALGRREQAKMLIERALAIHAVRGDNPIESRPAMSRLASIEENLGQFTSATEHQERVVELARAEFDATHPMAISELSKLARLYSRTDQESKAFALHQRAYLAAEATQDPVVRMSAALNFAGHLARFGDRTAAIFFGKRAVAAIQGIRASSTNLDRALTDKFESGIAPMYQVLADWLVQEGRVAEAEQVAAMLKDRELFELTRQSSTATAGRAVSMSGAEIALNRQMDELRQAALAQANELDALNRKLRQEKSLSPGDERRRDQLVEAQSAWGRDFQRFMAALQPALAKEPADAQRQRDAIESGARSPLMRVLRDAQAEKGSQRPVAVTYIVAEESLSILVTTPEAVFARRVNVNRKELFERIARLRAILQRPDLDPRPAAQTLYQSLIAPIEGDLAALKADFILLNLNGMLRYIPFAALHDGKQYLVQRWPLALYTSAGNTQVAAATAASWRVQGFGMTRAATVMNMTFDPLGLALDELAAVVRTEKTPQGALPGRLDLNESFTRKSFQGALASANSGDLAVMHIASHFNVAIGSDDLTFLLLGDSKPLLLRDLKDMDFRGVQLLVLSACDTAMPAGRNENGSEIEGMAAAAQLAGARTVLATLWRVADESTAALMRRFYQIRTTPASGGMTHAMALRRAQLDLIEGRVLRTNDARDPIFQPSATKLLPRVSIAETPPFNKKSSRDLSHPYYWAPFVLMGNWL